MNNNNVGQPLIIGVPGAELTDGLRQWIRDIQPGGFILFHRNIAEPEQLFHLISELHALCDIPPIVTLDQEGGRVSRLKLIGETPPSAQDLRKAGNIDGCREHGTLTGKLLSLFGFNLNLAPVVDYSPDDDADNSLKGRCYGQTPQEVVEKAGAFLNAMQSEGVGATIKHFPGYTFCEKDPHGALPKIHRSEKEIWENELLPFRELSNAASVMIGHGHFTEWHEEPFPASLSFKIVQQLLREKMDYRGLIMTDDIEMGAVANMFGSAETVRLAMEAGNDTILICHNPACVELGRDALAQMPQEKLASALERIARFKRTLPRTPEKLDIGAFKKINNEIRILRENVQSRMS